MCFPVTQEKQKRMWDRLLQQEVKKRARKESWDAVQVLNGTPLIDTVLSPAAMQTLTCSDSLKKRKSFWQHKLLCLYVVTHMELLKPFAPSRSAEHFWDMQTVWELKLWVFLRRQTPQKLARKKMFILLLAPMHFQHAYDPKKKFEGAEILYSSALKLLEGLGNWLFLMCIFILFIALSVMLHNSLAV